MIQSKSATSAKNYFSDALIKSDYYLDEQELVGKFKGKIAQRLGVSGIASKDVFSLLCENINPVKGKALTSRKKRQRTSGYDINFHCPKSVSVLHVLSKDNHILDAFQDSVHDIMCEIEDDSKTRLRKNGKNEDHETGELLWADFVHQTARPVEGVMPDPHLHCHCFTFNVTWDDIERKYKAGQFRDIKRDMPYYQAKFHKNLSDRLIELGYGIRKTKTSFEVEGIPEDVIALFSKRTNEIGQAAKQFNITNPGELDKLGSKTRGKKQKGSSMSALKKDWRRQIKAKGLEGNRAKGEIISHDPDRKHRATNPHNVIGHALSHSFERASVLQDRRILQKAYQYATGFGSVPIAGIDHEFDTNPDILKVKQASQTLCTTSEVIAQETAMIQLAKGGKDKFEPFYAIPPQILLAAEQNKAITHVLSSADQCAIIEGRAGTGKTTLMKETIRLIEDTGKAVVVVAPTSQASRGVLKDEGFEGAETVAKLLSDPSLQDSIRDGVLWVDEAGLLGLKDMTAVLQLAEDKNARVILSGDTKQHSSVAGGDALRLVKLYGDVNAVSLTTIYRQKNAQYREAVKALATGETAHCFKILDDLNSIKVINKASPASHLADDYLETVEKRKTALVISPTHAQGDEVTLSIRQKLKKAGRLGKKDKQFKKLVNCNLTNAEKSDYRNYGPGMVIQFTQNAKEVKRGSAWTVKAVNDTELVVTGAKGNVMNLPVGLCEKWDVFKTSVIPLARKDKIHITRNSFDSKRNRLNNGQELEIVSISKKGNIIARNPRSKTQYVLDKDFGHLAHGYVTTSHAAQGKTVDEVFIYQPSSTFPATDRKQFYVSVSRGREVVHVYTDDKQALIDHASEMRDRQSGLELLSFHEQKEILSAQGNTQLASRTKRVIPALNM
jgi:conjugative relaxase-like TrwC/TraI family protein